MLRRISSHRSGPSPGSRAAGKAAIAQSYSRGPLVPSPAVRRFHAWAGGGGGEDVGPRSGVALRRPGPVDWLQGTATT